MALNSFESTIWSLVRRASDLDQAAVEDFMSKYRAPLVEYIRYKGQSDSDADDLAQEVFIKLFYDGVIEKADPQKGSFRNLLLTVARAHLTDVYRKKMAQKRGGDKNHVSLDQLQGSGQEPESEEQDDSVFDELWIKNLLERGLEKLQEISRRKKTHHYEALYQYLFENKSYQSIAEEHGRKINQIKQDIFLGRKKLKQYIVEEIQVYAKDHQDLENELKFLEKYLA